MSLEERNIEKLKPFILIQNEREKEEIFDNQTKESQNENDKKQVKNHNKPKSESLKYRET